MPHLAEITVTIRMRIPEGLEQKKLVTLAGDIKSAATTEVKKAKNRKTATIDHIFVPHVKRWMEG